MLDARTDIGASEVSTLLFHPIRPAVSVANGHPTAVKLSSFS
jgi:hypothetical protein